MEWFFDGLGSEIISALIGALLGGTGMGIVCRIKYRKNIQKQKANDNANQTQIGGITNINGKE